jgi:hypothetical protein
MRFRSGLLSRNELPLVVGQAKRVRLPNRRLVRVELLEQLPPETFRIAASINRPNGKDYLPLLEVRAKKGQAFIVAGQSYQEGILVLVFRVVR